MSSLRSALRKHLHFIVVVSILLVVMTWPTIVYVFDTETFWLPSDSRDMWKYIWDAWHSNSVLAGKASPYFTDMLFYPIGMSLVYHADNIIYRILQGMLHSIMEMSNAVNLVYLLIVFSTTLAGYVYLKYQFKNRWVALFGAVVFGFSQHVVGHPSHPSINTLFTVPLTMYALQRGTNEQKRTWMLVGGVLLGVTALVSIYIFVCLLITLGLYILCFTYSSWKQRKFWTSLILFFAVAVPISLVQIYPLIRDTSRLDEALNKKLGQERFNDLLSFFVSSGHPLMTPIFVSVFDLDSGGDKDIRDQHQTSYLGYLPLLLIALGLSSRAHRRKMIPWLFLLLPFLILRLGSTLRINGELIEGVLLPKHYLNDIFPWVFRAVYATDHFQIGVILPLAVLSCFGLQFLLKSVSKKRWSVVVVGAVALVAFEYYQTPLSLVISEQEISFNTWLKHEPNQEELRLINLPMGRRSSKIYGFYQTINSYPHVEGLANRTPAQSYDYIRQNPLLAAWLQGMNVECKTDNFDNYLVAIDILLRDGFSHVVFHRNERDAELVADSFSDIPPAYQDEYVSIYRLPDLRATCLDQVATYQNQLPDLLKFLNSPINQPRSDVALVYLSPAQDFSSEAQRYYGIVLSEWKNLIHIVYDEQGAAGVTSSRVENTDLDSITTQNNVFLLIYNPQVSDPRSESEYATWMAQNLKSCQLKFSSEELIVEHLIDRDYPCELIVAETALEVRYDNGITLANLLADWDGDQLSIDSWWQRGKYRGYAYTIQVFNEQGEKQLQIDQVIDSRPLSHAQINTSSLEPGDYVAKLIVYDKESGESQSGTILSTQQTVERELEIARFSVSD